MSPIEEVIKYSVSRMVAYMDEDFSKDKDFDDGVHFGLYIAMSILKHDIDILCEEGMLEKTGLDFDFDSLVGKHK